MTERFLYPRTPLHGRVAHEIGRQIVVGKIAEGSLLPRESALADKFDVSRQAIREALKVLAAKGLVVSRRRTGTQVQPRTTWNLLDPDVLAWHPVDRLPQELFADLVALRRVVEPAAAELAANRRDPKSVAAIAEAVAEMEQRSNGDATAFNDADMRFHLAVFAASGNALFQRLGLVIRPLLLLSLHRQTEARDEAIDVIGPHATIANAIASGDAVAAREEMRRIVEQANYELGYTDVSVYGPRL